MRLPTVNYLVTTTFQPKLTEPDSKLPNTEVSEPETNRSKLKHWKTDRKKGTWFSSWYMFLKTETFGFKPKLNQNVGYRPNYSPNCKHKHFHLTLD